MRRLLLAIALGALCGGCGQVTGQDAIAPPAEPGSILDEQARQALARWDEAVAKHGDGPRFVPIDGGTGQLGDWELTVGDNNKPAAMSGLFEVATGAVLPPDPGPAEVRWDDGETITLPLLSATAALQAMKDEGQGRCIGCKHLTPLQVTGARLTTVAVHTDRGQATAPAWAYTLAGTAVEVTRLAVAPSATAAVTPPPWDPFDSPGGLSVESATVAADGRTVTAHFVGAAEGTGPCTSDYTARAVESAHAAVIIIEEHSNGDGTQACTAMGHSRTATVTLAQPLAARTLLEVRQGMPIPTTR